MGISKFDISLEHLVPIVFIILVWLKFDYIKTMGKLAPHIAVILSMFFAIITIRHFYFTIKSGGRIDKW